MHFGDYTFIFLLALVLFGPKKLPEIGKQLGKLLAEFRRASNEFKYQIQEELRNMEEDERRKKRAEEQAALAAATAPESVAPATPAILPPSTGTQVSTSKPYATPVEPEPTPLDGGAAPNTTEVIVEPENPSPSMDLAAGIESSSEIPASVDLTVPSNGNHASSPESLTHAGEPAAHG